MRRLVDGDAVDPVAVFKKLEFNNFPLCAAVDRKRTPELHLIAKRLDKKSGIRREESDKRRDRGSAGSADSQRVFLVEEEKNEMYLET